MQNPTLYIERPCKDFWIILNIYFQIEQIQTGRNDPMLNCPPIGTFLYLQKHVSHLIYNHPSWGGNWFPLKKHRISSVKFSLSEYMMETAIFC